MSPGLLTAITATGLVAMAGVLLYAVTRVVRGSEFRENVQRRWRWSELPPVARVLFISALLVGLIAGIVLAPDRLR